MLKTPVELRKWYPKLGDPCPVFRAGYVRPPQDPIQLDRTPEAGETIEWEGYKIQVDRVPGGTESGCCLWFDLDGKRIAFTGDNLFGNRAEGKQSRPCGKANRSNAPTCCANLRRR